jgi:hypothetical protein
MRVAMNVDGIFDFYVRWPDFTGLVLRARSVRGYTAFMSWGRDGMCAHRSSSKPALEPLSLLYQSRDRLQSEVSTPR